MKIQWKSMPSPGKGKAKKNPARASRVARTEKKATQAKITARRQRNTHDSKVNVETVGNIDKAADCWYMEKSKSKVTEISQSDSSRQVEEHWTSNTSAQRPNFLSQVNATGCADEGLWIFSLEDSKKRRYTVNWEDQSSNQTEEHELMIESECFRHVCPPWFAPQFPMVSSTNVEVVAANNVALQQLGQKVVYGHVMTNNGRRILIQITFDVTNVRKPLRTEISWRHNHLQS